MSTTLSRCCSSSSRHGTREVQQLLGYISLRSMLSTAVKLPRSAGRCSRFMQAQKVNAPSRP